MYKIAKSRARSQRDVGDVQCVRDENGEVLVRDDEIQDRWRRYFAALMNEGVEPEEQKEEDGEEKQQVELVSTGEVEHALRKMKAGKAVGPDETPVEVWKIVYYLAARSVQ